MMSFLTVKRVQKGLKKGYIEMRDYFYFGIVIKHLRRI